VSLRQKVRLELEDGTQVEAEYSAIDLRAWEKVNRRSALSEPISVSMLTWLGWSAAKRQGSINGAYATYEAFDVACVSVEGVDDEEPADEEEVPTQAVKKTATRKAPGPDSSAPSP
jgi:hypothetical protein